MFRSLALAAALSTVAGVASASTLLYDSTLIPVSGDSDTTFFDADNDFNESFDFSAVDYASIDRFELTLDVSGAMDERRVINLGPFGSFSILEDWNIRVQGSASGAADDLFDDMTDGMTTYTINAASDTGGIDVFAHSVATGEFTFWLSESSPDLFLTNPSITVNSANLKVYGTLAPIPLPAGLPLLLGALGGLAFVRRKMG